LLFAVGISVGTAETPIGAAMAAIVPPRASVVAGLIVTTLASEVSTVSAATSERVIVPAPFVTVTPPVCPAIAANTNPDPLPIGTTPFAAALPSLPEPPSRAEMGKEMVVITAMDGVLS